VRARWQVTELDHRREDGPRLSAPGQGASGLHELARAGNDRIAADGQQISRLGADGRARWTYSCTARPREAYACDDRLLVVTDSLEYTPWGLLGPAFLIDLGDGSLVAQLRGDHGAAAGGGRFVLGLEGYDFFHTWLHDRAGATLMTWKSQGHYVVDPGESIRVIECDRATPTRSRVVRLLPGGEIERGPELSDGQVSRPVVLEDGTAVFADSGLLRAVDRDLRGAVLAALLPVAPGEAWRFRAQLELDGYLLTVTVDERTPDAPMRYTTYRWTYRVHHSS
jgi:hypothetical protein